MPVQLAKRQLPLPPGGGEEFRRRFPVPGVLQVVAQAGDKEQGVVKQGGVVHLGPGLQEQAGPHPPLVLGEPGEQVQAPLDQSVVLKGGVVGQGLQAQVGDPQAAVPLGSVLEYQLHAVPHGSEGYPVQLFQLWVGHVQRRDGGQVGGGDASARHTVHHHLVLGGGVQHGEEQIAEGVPPGQFHPGGEHVHVDGLLLNPGPAHLAAVAGDVGGNLVGDLSEAQSEKGRGIGGTAHRGEGEGHIAHLMAAEIQTEGVVPAHGAGRGEGGLQLFCGKAAAVGHDGHGPDGGDGGFDQDGGEGLGLCHKVLVDGHFKIFNRVGDSHGWASSGGVGGNFPAPGYYT